MQWLYEAFYTAIGELFADINNLGVEIFDLSWVQAVVNLFTMLGWSLFVVGVAVAVFEVAIESQSGRVNVKGTALNVLKGFFAASLVGVLPVQLYKTCCHLQGIFTADLAGIFAGEQSSTIGAFAGQILSIAFDPNAAVQVGLKLIFFLLAFAYCVIKVFFANIKRGGILLVQTAVGSLYLFSVPRGYTDGFYQWCKQVAALMKLLLTNLREAGKRVLVLDAEGEYGELAENNGGCCLDLLDGQYMINILEPKVWASEPVEDPDAPEAFRKSGRIGQHIAFLKDWFRSCKDFTDAEVDTIEIMLSQLYREFGLTEKTDFSKLKPENYPILSDLYKLCLQEYYCYDKKNKLLYTEETLRNICLGLNSICVGSESRFFNGNTNIQDNMFLVFGVKGVMDLNKKLRCAIEFNILSYMTHQLLSVGNCVAALDELYLFLDSPVTTPYIRNNMKRVRKKESAMVLASQNIEDFLLPNIREMTKPLFSIPTHQFLFNPGQINPKDYMDALQVEQAEYDLIHSCERGHNLYRCGNERYLLQVIAPEHKVNLFGNAGGR